MQPLLIHEDVKNLRQRSIKLIIRPDKLSTAELFNVIFHTQM